MLYTYPMQHSSIHIDIYTKIAHSSKREMKMKEKYDMIHIDRIDRDWFQRGQGFRVAGLGY